MNYDWIANGNAYGDVATRLLRAGGDAGALRPFIGDDGRAYMTLNGRNVLTNAPTSLPKQAWSLFDDAVLKTARQRLKAWGDLARYGLMKDIPNGMAKTVIQYQNRTNMSGATISMDPARYSDRDRSEFDLVNLPMPVIHKDFSFSVRELMASGNAPDSMGGGTQSLDTVAAEDAARAVAEEAEKLLLGVTASYAFGGGTIYGYTNFPYRATKTMTAPTGTNPSATLADVLDMKTKSQDMNHYGPWVLYVSTSWDKYLDNDYILSGGNVATQTLRERLSKIEGIRAVQTLDFLPTKTMVLVELNPMVVRGINGLSLTTVEWDTHGGFEKNYKVLAIMVPQIRADESEQTGIVHGTHA